MKYSIIVTYAIGGSALLETGMYVDNAQRHCDMLYKIDNVLFAIIVPDNRANQMIEMFEDTTFPIDSFPID